VTAAGDGGSAGAAAAAAARARLIAGSVRVKVTPEVFQQILADAAGPVVHVSGFFLEAWWVVYGGFAFRCNGGGISVPAGLEVIEAKSAE
jgi:hypothetical protein